MAVVRKPIANKLIGRPRLQWLGDMREGRRKVKINCKSFVGDGEI